MTDRSSILVRVFGATARHPRVTLAVAAMCGALGLVGAMRIHPTGSIEAMLPGDDRAAVALNRITDEFGVLDQLIVLATVSDAAATKRERADRLRSFAERLDVAFADSAELGDLCSAVSYRDLPQLREFVERELVPTALLHVDPDTFARLRERLSTEDIRRQISENEELISAPGASGHALSKLILRDPLRLHQMLAGSLRSRFGTTAPSEAEGGGLTLSRDGSTLMIRLTGTRSVRDLGFAKRFFRASVDACERANVDDLSLEYTGAYAIAVEAEASIRGDMTRSITLSFVFLGLLFLLVYRSGLSFPVAVLPVGLGILCGFGLSSFYSTALTPIVAVMGAVLTGLAIDYSIHFMSHYGDGAARGLSHADAVKTTLADVGPAMAMACTTSLVGFLALSFSTIPALRQLAVLGVLGLGCSLVATLTLLPVLMSGRSKWLLGIGQPRAFGQDLSLVLRALDAHSARFVTGACVVLIGLVAVFVVAPGGGFHFDSDLTAMHPQPNPPVEAQRTIAERFGRDPDALVVHLQASSPDDLLSLAHRIDRRLRTEEVRAAGLVGALGLATLLPDPEAASARVEAVAAMDADEIVADFQAAIDDSLFDPEVYRDYAEFLRTFCRPDALPDWRALLGYPSVAGMVLPSSVVDSESAPTEAITVLFMDRSLDTRARRDRAIDAVRGALDGLPDATLTGVAVVSHDTERVVWSELQRLLSVAVVVVALCLFVYYRRISDVVLALLPALFGIGSLLGVMDLIDLRLNMINLIGIPLLLGIGVDDGVFLVSLAAAHRRRGTARPMLQDRMAAGCHAIVMTTVSTLLTFGTLVFTSTPAIRSLGVMVGVGMSAALAGTIFLLAPILLRRAASR